jgi:hypothetical protein
MLFSWYDTALQWLESLMLPCVFKMIFKTDCPGCGLQRSILLLLRGRWEESIQLYWATIPILLLFAFCFVQLKRGYKWGNKMLVFLYALAGILIFCQYFYKLSNHN